MIMMKELGLILLLSTSLIGCQSNAPNIQTNESPSPSMTPEIVKPSSSVLEKQPQVTKEFLISEQGIGLAQLGMTFQQLKQTLGVETTLEIISPFIVDFDAIAVPQAGDIQYYILYPSGITFTDSDVIELLFTNHPNYRTTEGVGVGKTLQEVQAIYGQAILSYNMQAESRETVRFANYSPPNIVFMTKRDSEAFVGIYSSPSGEYNETQNFNQSAKIGAIFVGR